MIGIYYLHTNGDLIFKNKAVFTNTSVHEYMDSPFVKKYWIIPEKSPTGDQENDIIWTMDWLREAYELSDDKTRTERRIREICKKNEFPDIVANAIIEGKEKKEAAR